MGVKVNRCDIVPPLSGSAGVPVNAPYLLNGVDPSGLLTAEVNVLALATPQPFIATAPIAGDVGLPITLAYDNGAGAVGTGVGLQFKAQNAADATKDICTVVVRLTDATAASEDSEIDLGVLTAGAEQTALTIADTGLSLNGSTGAKTITTSKGNLTVSTTGAGNGVTVSSAAASADLTGTTTATVSAGSGAATLRSTAAGAVVVGQTTASLTATTGAASVVATAGAASVTGATTAAVQAGTGDLSLTSAVGDINMSAGGSSRWKVVGSTGALTAQGNEKVSGIGPGTVAGDAVEFAQLFDAGLASPTNGGPAVNAVPGALMIAPVAFSAPTGGAGTFLVRNNTGAFITIVGIRAFIPTAGANTLAITASNGATALFSAATLAATGGSLAAATTYTTIDASIANNANITISAEGSGAPIDTLLYVEYFAG